MTTNAKIFIGVIVILILGVVLTISLRSSAPVVGVPGQYDEFAICLKDKGAVFYGAFWCKYCNAQKKMFGASQKLLPYEECSTPDGRSQLPFCKDKGITSYPLWEFADGSRLNGVVSFEQLAEKTSCVLPAENNSQ